MISKCNHAQVAKKKLIRHTKKTAMKQLHKTTSRRAIRVRHDFARECSGLVWGNHGSKRFTEPYFSDESVGDVIESKTGRSSNVSHSKAVKDTEGE